MNTGMASEMHLNLCIKTVLTKKMPFYFYNTQANINN